MNQNSGGSTKLGATESILMEVKPGRGCALNRRRLSEEKCRKGSKKVRKDRSLGWSSAGGREDWEGVCGGRREGMIEEGGRELRPCRVTQS